MRDRSSIRLRLTLWYAGSILLLFLATGVLLRGALRTTLANEFDHDALDSSILVRNFFHVEFEEYHTTDDAIADLMGEIFFRDRVLQFVRPDGRVLAIRSSAPRASSSPLSPPLRELIVPLDSSLAPGWTLRVISSAAELERALRRIDRWFALGVPLAALLAAALGWSLTGRLLRPVEAMATAAGRITAAEPSARLPVVNPHDELGRLGRHFNALLDRLDEALSQQRRFLADAAHTLRTPLTRITSQIELALASGNDVATPSAALALIQEDVRHTARLVDELMQLARADAGEQARRGERLFLDDVLMDAASAWRALAEQRGVRIELPEVEETPACLDALLARRLVDILLENAIRYTPAGGVVTACVRRVRDGVALEIADSGIGISDDERPRVFERFFRGSAARRMAPEGSGLGLPIAAWIARQFRGAIEVANATPRGTVVRVTLPAETEPTD